MLERVQERLFFDLGSNIKVMVYRLPRKASYVCRITFPDGEVIDSIAERLSWTTVDGARQWARNIVEGVK